VGRQISLLAPAANLARDCSFAAVMSARTGKSIPGFNSHKRAGSLPTIYLPRDNSDARRGRNSIDSSLRKLESAAAGHYSRWPLVEPRAAGDFGRWVRRSVKPERVRFGRPNESMEDSGGHSSPPNYFQTMQISDSEGA